jgi:hypothetical protein
MGNEAKWKAFRINDEINVIVQWFPTCGTHTPGGTRRTGWGYTKIILVMAENSKKNGVKIKTQKQRYVI